MRRAVVPLALVLALISGVVLAEARLVVLAPIEDDGTNPLVQDNSALIRRFYAAVNETVESGDADSLSRLLDPEFVDHAPRPGTTPDRAGFARAVASLHAVAPNVRLTVVDTVSQGDRVVARVGIENGEAAAFLGLPLADAQLWESIDVFRIAAGRIVEHWTAPAMLGLFEPLLNVSVPVERPMRNALTLERWTYAPDAAETWTTTRGFLIVLADAGTLTIEVDARSSGGVQQLTHGQTGGASGGRQLAPGEAATLEPGDAAVIPQANQVTVRNDGALPAIALVVQALMVVLQGDTVSVDDGAAKETGIVRQVLAGGLTANLAAGRATIAIGRTMLAAGADLRHHRADVAELVAVETGALEVAADDDGAWVTSQVEGTHRANGDTVPVGGGVFVEAGTRAGYGASGDTPLGLLLVRIGTVGTDSAEGEAPTASPIATAQ